MNNTIKCCIGLLLFTAACNPKKINPDLIPGKYYSNEYLGDSIFIYSDKSYEYIFYHKDKIAESVKGTWKYKPEINSIFFENFRFYSQSGPSDFSGTWSPKVILTEDEKIALQYSENVYYLKVDEMKIMY